MEEEPEKLTYKAQPKEVKKKPGKCGVKKKREKIRGTGRQEITSISSTSGIIFFFQFG